MSFFQSLILPPIICLNILNNHSLSELVITSNQLTVQYNPFWIRPTNLRPAICDSMVNIHRQFIVWLAHIDKVTPSFFSHNTPYPDNFYCNTSVPSSVATDSAYHRTRIASTVEPPALFLLYASLRYYAIAKHRKYQTTPFGGLSLKLK